MTAAGGRARGDPACKAAKPSEDPADKSRGQVIRHQQAGGVEHAVADPAMLTVSQAKGKQGGGQRQAEHQGNLLPHGPAW